MPHPAGSTADDRFDLLRRARARYASGAVAAAWTTVQRVVELSRHEGDAVTLADAALIIRPLHNRSLQARIHDLAAAA